MMWIDDIDVVVETVKTAEDGSGDLIVRLYESKRSARDTVLRTAFAAEEAWETDMLENKLQPIPFAGDGQIPLAFRPFEIKTVRIRV